MLSPSSRRLLGAAARWVGLAAIAVSGLATLVGSGGGGGGGSATPVLTVVTTTPTNTATGVALATAVSATFSENLATTPTFTVSSPGGAVAGSVARAGATATFTPAAALAFSTTYTASVSGASGASGAVQSGATTWTFTTLADPNSPPSITLSATTVAFSAAPGGANPAAQTVAITNGGGGTLSGLTATVGSYTGGATGWLQASLNATSAPATLTLTPTTGALAAGNYAAVVTLAGAAGTANTPRLITVNFTVAAAAAVTISGTVDFESVPSDTTANGRLLYANKTNKVVRGATVQLIAAAGGAVLASTETSATGTYTLNLATAQSVFVRVRAEMVRTGTAPTWNFSVRDNTQGDGVYVMDTAAFTPVTGANTQNLRALSGQTGSSTSYTGARVAGPFSILDVVYDAKEKMLSASASAAFPALQLMWSVNNRPTGGNLATGLIGTSFYQQGANGHRIYILGFADTDTDEYDRTVVAHEFGHYMQNTFSRDDNIGGSHGSGDKLDMRVAFSEGFGNAWSGMALATQFYTDSLGAGQQSGFVSNLANSPGAGNRGWFIEASVQYLMYTLHQNPAIGFTPIFNVLNAFTSGLATDGALSGIHYFAFKLKQAVPGQAAAIDTLLAGQTIIAADALGSTETNNGNVTNFALPIYKQHTAAIGVAQQYCVTDAGGSGGTEFNRLGAQAYIRIPLAAAGSRSIVVTAVTAGSDPDFRLFRPNGVETDFEAGGVTETAALGAVGAGTHVIVLYDYNLTHDQGSSGSLTGQRCFNVTVQ
jgi:hypothetical protein